MRNKMRPIHPGEILREEFVVPLELSGNALAMELHVPANRINNILKEKRALTADTALRLARYFGMSAEFWMNIQKTYELRMAELEVGATILKDITPGSAPAPAARAQRTSSQLKPKPSRSAQSTKRLERGTGRSKRVASKGTAQDIVTVTYARLVKSTSKPRQTAEAGAPRPSPISHSSQDRVPSLDFGARKRTSSRRLVAG